MNCKICGVKTVTGSDICVHCDWQIAEGFSKETLKEMLVETNAKALEKSVNSEREWFAEQTRLIEENHKLKQEIERLKTMLDDIENEIPQYEIDHMFNDR